MGAQRPTQALRIPSQYSTDTSTRAPLFFWSKLDGHFAQTDACIPSSNVRSRHFATTTSVAVHPVTLDSKSTIPLGSQMVAWRFIPVSILPFSLCSEFLLMKVKDVPHVLVIGPWHGIIRLRCLELFSDFEQDTGALCRSD
jgi:hypothetical protein